MLGQPGLEPTPATGMEVSCEGQSYQVRVDHFFKGKIDCAEK